jgi:hypothetical protein
MILDMAMQRRIGAGEITIREAFAMQSALDDPGPTDTGVFVSDAMAQSPLVSSMREVCLRHGIRLARFDTRHGYRANRRAMRNLATWGVKWPSKWYRRGGRNVLYLENGLLHQAGQIYIDHAGFFCDSSIATEKQPDPEPAEVAAMQAHCRRYIGDWWRGPTPGGPIMLAGQVPRDCSVRYHYAPARGNRPALVALIEDAAKYLSADAHVIVRPHPRAKHSLDGIQLPDGWTVDRSPNVYQTLATCSALVTTTSTLATEALAIGLPVATLGRGAFVGSGAVLECAEDPARLATLPEWQPEEWPVIRYLCAVMRHQLPTDATPDMVRGNVSFREWLRRAGVIVDPTEGLTLEQAVKKIQDSGNAAAKELLSAIQKKMEHCPKCAKGRLRREVVQLAGRL